MKEIKSVQDLKNYLNEIEQRLQELEKWKRKIEGDLEELFEIEGESDEK